ncbi:MAG: hypothetical protein GF409_05410 [Candidatus Omnitrophica bacterium]|nr:hypothetical protein [Candidatus Omnitrophota bacterium]
MFSKLAKDIDKALLDLSGQLKGSEGYRLLYKGIKDFMLRPGKRIRPVLFMTAYRGYTKKKRIPAGKLARSALSVELLHDFLLVHDDVIDNSAVRRGKPSLHRFFNKELSRSAGDKIGSDLSIVAGDIIFALAVDALMTVDETPLRKQKALEKFTEAARLTGIGEFIDVVNDTRSICSMKKEDILRAYELKTARYTFEAPLLIGAILAGAPESERKKLSGLGVTLGQAFQIYDDLLDTFSTSEKIGKPVLSDLAESKKTLMVWKTYNTLKGKDRRLLKELLEKDKKTRSDLLKFRRLITSSGSDRYCANKVLSLLLEAGTVCAGLKMRSGPKKTLRQFIRSFYSKTVTFSK